MSTPPRSPPPRRHGVKNLLAVDGLPFEFQLAQGVEENADSRHGLYLADDSEAKLVTELLRRIEFIVRHPNSASVGAHALYFGEEVR